MFLILEIQKMIILISNERNKKSLGNGIGMRMLIGGEFPANVYRGGLRS